jgi:hypothetical protein
MGRKTGLEDPTLLKELQELGLERARRLIAAMLSSGADQPGVPVTSDDLVAHCEQIAAASGGILGSRLGSISSEEKALLSRIASDLEARRR